jgi:hypothetical protein
MSDYLTTLVARSVRPAEAIRPRAPLPFEPVAGDTEPGGETVAAPFIPPQHPKAAFPFEPPAPPTERRDDRPTPNTGPRHDAVDDRVAPAPAEDRPPPAVLPPPFAHAPRRPTPLPSPIPAIPPALTPAVFPSPDAALPATSPPVPTPPSARPVGEPARVEMSDEVTRIVRSERSGVPNRPVRESHEDKPKPDGEIPHSPERNPVLRRDEAAPPADQNESLFRRLLAVITPAPPFVTHPAPPNVLESPAQPRVRPPVNPSAEVPTSAPPRVPPLRPAPPADSPARPHATSPAPAAPVAVALRPLVAPPEKPPLLPADVPAPVIEVTIGRIEVRAERLAAPAAATRRPAPVVMSLDDYLRRRRGGAP